MFLKVSQNSQENNCAVDSFLTKLFTKPSQTAVSIETLATHFFTFYTATVEKYFLGRLGTIVSLVKQLVYSVNLYP